jgi:stress response protein YsnF
VKDTEHVADTVRKEELRVEKQGDVDVSGAAAKDITPRPDAGR